MEESGEISEPQLYQSEIDENEPDEEWISHSILKLIMVVKLWRFLEMKPNSDFYSF